MSVDRPQVETDVFIVGPARAGTSWLQTTLAEHPTFGSPPETELFSSYIAPLYRAWQRHKDILSRSRRDGDAQMAYGLPTALEKSEFDAAVRAMYTSIRAAVLSGKPGATRLLEKTPDHVLFVRELRRVVPDAQLLFLVRDPRDTVRSLLEASLNRWGHWAPTNVDQATDLWLRNVRAGLRNMSDPSMLLVRYEDLAGDPEELERIAKFLGLDAPQRWLTTPLSASPGERATTIVRGEAAHAGINPYRATAFSFHDRAKRRPLTPAERAYVSWRCRPEMEQLGYDREPGHMSVRMQIRRAMASARARINRRRG
jgi:hypothetical protein